MCLIAFALHASSRHALLLAANRDEFHDRPALAAHAWPDQAGLYGGRDLSAGGTWLGLHRGGRLAALTNFREGRPAPAGERSRGELSHRFLSSTDPLEDFSAALLPELDRYAGFNLLLFDWWSGTLRCNYLSNRHERRLQTVGEGVHGLSNHLLGTPWPKVERLRGTLTQVLDSRDDPFPVLLDALADHRAVAPEEFPDGSYPGDSSPLLRTPFIADSRYGTRASTVVSVGHDGAIRFMERTWRWESSAAVVTGERSFEITP